MTARLGSRRPSEVDSRRLRGQSRRARRPADRSLPPARTGSAHVVADVGAHARAASRRGSRPQCRSLERQPPAARRGARARTGRGCPGRAQPVRRRRAARGRRRPVRRGGDRSDGALAPRRSRVARGAWVESRSSPARLMRVVQLPRRWRSRGCSGSRPLSSRFPARAGRRPHAPRLGLQRSPSTPMPTAALARAFGRPRVGRPRSRAGSEVVVVMGIPGAGKSHVAEEYVARGYVRLNRDERGGTLRALAVTLAEELESPDARVVLDNTYLTRASRSYVLDAAARHGAPVRCVWLDTPLAQAQVNLTARLLDRFGGLPGPADLRELAKREQGVLAPTSQMRAVRELEPPFARRGVPRSRATRVHPRAAWRNARGRLRRCVRGAGERLGRRGGRSASRVRLAPRRQRGCARRAKSSVSLRTSRARSKRPFVLIPAVRRRAGAGRRCPD